MIITKHGKISSIISGSLFGLLLLSIILHNFMTALTGEEDKLFFLLFILLFFLFPASLIYVLIILIITAVKNLKQKKVKEGNIEQS